MDTLLAILVTLVLLDSFIGFAIYRRMVKTCVQLSGYDSSDRYAEAETRRIMRSRPMWQLIAVAVAVAAAVIIYRSKFPS
jgi:hypothetical protein